jgi:hypothetical protein
MTNKRTRSRAVPERAEAVLHEGHRYLNELPSTTHEAGRRLTWAQIHRLEAETAENLPLAETPPAANA